jgi:hypothetical protein
VTATGATAAATLLRISETERGDRARRAAAGALVLRVVEGRAADPFTLRRAGAEVAALPAGPERSILTRLLVAVERGAAAPRLAAILVAYACELERTRRLPEADTAIGGALVHAGCDASTALHAARLARKLGERERALALYCAAREMAGGDGPIARLAAVGEAVVSGDPVPSLGTVIRAALASGDAEAASVGLEERAAARRATGDLPGAARDLWGAAARFIDPVDRARAAHALAGVLLSAGDAAAACEALLVALAWGDAPQREHALARLHTLARDRGDRVGMRRWRSFERPSLVSLSAYRASTASPRSRAGRLRRWRERLGRPAA